MLQAKRESVKRIRMEKVAWVRAIKEIRGCSICREKDPIVLELHHDNVEKHHRLRTRRRHSYANLSWPDLREEVNKCSILCANCHRRITFRERRLE